MFSLILAAISIIKSESTSFYESPGAHLTPRYLDRRKGLYWPRNKRGQPSFFGLVKTFVIIMTFVMEECPKLHILEFDQEDTVNITLTRGRHFSVEIYFYSAST